MEGFLDYLTREMEATFNQGKQVWDKPNNFEVKRRLVGDALNRAKIMFDLAKKEMDLIGGD